MCMSDFVSDVWGIDFKQNLHEPVKALLPKPRPRGGGPSGSSLGSWTPQRLPGTEGVGPSAPSVGAEEASPSLQSPGPAAEGLRGLFLETVQELSSGHGHSAATQGPRPGRGGGGPAERCLRAPRSQGRGQSRSTGGAYVSWWPRSPASPTGRPPPPCNLVRKLLDPGRLSLWSRPARGGEDAGAWRGDRG